MPYTCCVPAGGPHAVSGATRSCTAERQVQEDHTPRDRRDVKQGLTQPCVAEMWSLAVVAAAKGAQVCAGAKQACTVMVVCMVAACRQQRMALRVTGGTGWCPAVLLVRLGSSTAVMQYSSTVDGDSTAACRSAAAQHSLVVTCHCV
jgi:hypothetical protein